MVTPRYLIIATIYYNQIILKILFLVRSLKLSSVKMEQNIKIECPKAPAVES